MDSVNISPVLLSRVFPRVGRGEAQQQGRTILANQEGWSPAQGSFVIPHAPMLCCSRAFTLVEKGYGQWISMNSGLSCSLSKAPG